MTGLHKQDSLVGGATKGAKQNFEILTEHHPLAIGMGFNAGK